MQRKPTLAMPEKYNINMSTFEYGQPEELLAIIKNLKIEIDGIGTTSPSVRINYMCTMIRGEALIEFEKLEVNKHSTANAHIKQITEGLLRYFFPTNAFSNQNRAMQRAMHKP